MKPLFLSLLSLALAPQVFALVGGPFDQNSFQQNPASGTFQGVVTGNDLFGVFVMGVAPTSDVQDTGLTQIDRTGDTTITTSFFNLTSNEGRIAIWVRGELVVGTLSGSIQPGERSVDAVFEASGSLGNETITRDTSTTERTLGDAFTRTVITRDPVTGVITSTGEEPVLDPVTGLPLREADTLNVQRESEQFTFEKRVHVSGFFDGQISRSFPVEKLEGKGVATLEAPTGEILSEEIDNSTVLVAPVGAEPGTEAVTIDERLSRLTPEVEKTNIGIRVSGVKTSSQFPIFGTATTAERSQVVPGGAGGN